MEWSQRVTDNIIIWQEMILTHICSPCFCFQLCAFNFHRKRKLWRKTLNGHKYSKDTAGVPALAFKIGTLEASYGINTFWPINVQRLLCNQRVVIKILSGKEKRQKPQVCFVFFIKTREPTCGYKNSSTIYSKIHLFYSGTKVLCLGFCMYYRIPHTKAKCIGLRL